MVQVPQNLYCIVEVNTSRHVYVAATSYAQAEEKYMDKVGHDAPLPTKISLSAKATEFIA